MPTDRIIHATLKILMIEKYLVRNFPIGRKKNAIYKMAFNKPIYVEEAFSLRAKRVTILPTRKHQEMVLKTI